jgi:hypothetical protein
VSRKRPEATLRHRHARGASVEDLAVRFGLTRSEVAAALKPRPAAKLLQLRYWGNQYTAAENVFYSEQGQRLDALARDLERRAQRIEERWNAPLREHEKFAAREGEDLSAPLDRSFDRERTERD